MANPITLTNGLSSDWMDTSGLNTLNITGKLTGAATILIQGAGDPTLPTKGDIVALDTAYTADFAKVLYFGMTRFVRVTQTAGAGSCLVTFQGRDHEFMAVAVNKQGVKAGGPSGELFNSTP
jgi:hypothetical protein